MFVVGNEYFQQMTAYWNAARLVAADLNLLRAMRALTSRLSADAFLGPRGAVQVSTLTGFKGESASIASLSSGALLKFAQLDGTHCLHNLSLCSFSGFAVGLWFRLRVNNASASITQFALFQSNVLTISLTSNLQLFASINTTSALWSTSHTSIIPTNRFVHIAVTWSFSSGLQMFVYGNLVVSLSTPYVNMPASTQYTSCLYLSGGNSAVIAVDFRGFAYSNNFISTSNMYTTLGIAGDKQNLIATADDVLTFFGEWNILQPVVPAASGTAVLLVADRTGIGFGALTDSSSQSYITLATASVLADSTSAAGAGLRAVAAPGNCNGILVSFFLQIPATSIASSGYLFASGAELNSHQGVSLFMSPKGLNITISPSTYTISGICAINATRFMSWHQVKIIWDGTNYNLYCFLDVSSQLVNVCFPFTIEYSYKLF